MVLKHLLGLPFLGTPLKVEPDAGTIQCINKRVKLVFHQVVLHSLSLQHSRFKGGVNVQPFVIR